MQRTVGAAGVMPLPPWLPYADDPGTYSQWWLTETAGVDATEMEKEYEVYLSAFMGTIVDYQGIVLSLLLVADGLVFLTVLQGNQVFIVHLLGRLI